MAQSHSPQIPVVVRDVAFEVELAGHGFGCQDFHSIFGHEGHLNSVEASAVSKEEH